MSSTLHMLKLSLDIGLISEAVLIPLSAAYSLSKLVMFNSNHLVAGDWLGMHHQRNAFWLLVLFSCFSGKLAYTYRHPFALLFPGFLAWFFIFWLLRFITYLFIYVQLLWSHPIFFPPPLLLLLARDEVAYICLFSEGLVKSLEFSPSTCLIH